jgi:small-conductance mechanosensitive channel
MNTINTDLTTVGTWSLAGGVFAAWVVVGSILIHLIFLVIRKWAYKSGSLLSMLAKALPAPLYILVPITGIMFSIRFAPFLKTDEASILHVLRIILSLSVVYLVDNIIQGVIGEIEHRNQALKNSHFLFTASVHIVVWALGLMIILDTLGISITPLIASLGIGSLAVALAFQSTLSNLFSGIYILVDRPVHAGQYIKLSTGEEGTVEFIGWHSTQIRTLGNHMIILPNSKLAENLLQNYSLPNSRWGFSVEMGVDYSSDLARVEAVTMEVADQIQQTVSGATRDSKPSVCFHDFAASSINFSVNFEAEDYAKVYLIKHEFIKAVHARFRQEGIKIPAMVQTFQFQAETPATLSAKDAQKPPS